MKIVINLKNRSGMFFILFAIFGFGFFFSQMVLPPLDLEGIQFGSIEFFGRLFTQFLPAISALWSFLMIVHYFLRLRHGPGDRITIEDKNIELPNSNAMFFFFTSLSFKLTPSDITKVEIKKFGLSGNPTYFFYFGKRTCMHFTTYMVDDIGLGKLRTYIEEHLKHKLDDQT